MWYPLYMLAVKYDYSPGLKVTRALGDLFAKQIESGVVNTPFVSDFIELKDSDEYLILASDGVCFHCLLSCSSISFLTFAN